MGLLADLWRLTIAIVHKQALVPCGPGVLLAAAQFAAEVAGLIEDGAVPLDNPTVAEGPRNGLAPGWMRLECVLLTGDQAKEMQHMRDHRLPPKRKQKT